MLENRKIVPFFLFCVSHLAQFLCKINSFTSSDALLLWGVTYLVHEGSAFMALLGKLLMVWVTSCAQLLVQERFGELVRQIWRKVHCVLSGHLVLSCTRSVLKIGGKIIDVIPVSYLFIFVAAETRTHNRIKPSEQRTFHINRTSGFGQLVWLLHFLILLIVKSVL